MIEKKKSISFLFRRTKPQIEEENLVLLSASPLSLSRSFPLFGRVSDAPEPSLYSQCGCKSKRKTCLREEKEQWLKQSTLASSSRRSTTTATAATATTTTMRHRSRRPCTRTKRRPQQRRKHERDRGWGAEGGAGEQRRRHLCQGVGPRPCCDRGAVGCPPRGLGVVDDADCSGLQRSGGGTAHGVGGWKQRWKREEKAEEGRRGRR